MAKFNCTNGYTKEMIIDRIRDDFKGKSFNMNDRGWEGNCAYRTPDGRKCAVGLFIPDDHPACSANDSVTTLLINYPDLIPLMPLSHEFPLPLTEEDGSDSPLAAFQIKHDLLSSRTSWDYQKNTLIKWVEENVK